MKPSRLPFLFLATMLAACDDKPPASGSSTGAAPAPVSLKVDLSSPDRAIKSWWSYRDSIAAEDYQNCLEAVKKKEPHVADQIDKVAQEAILRHYQAFAARGCPQPSQYTREIQEVKVETETRAIVFALIKEATPPPAGAVPTDNDKRWREEGLRGKYLFEKTSEGWKLSQIYHFDTYPEPSWKEVYSADMIKPSYPSLVSGSDL